MSPTLRPPVASASIEKGEPTCCFTSSRRNTPQDCPYGKGGSRSLFDSESKDVKIHGYWLAFPQHTIYLVVETDDVVHLQKFLRPGVGVTVAEITPVSDQPAPLPD
jgi:hypothetical protein